MVDASALIAILKKESDATHFETILSQASRLILGSPTKLEVMMVAGGLKGDEGVAMARALISNLMIEIVSWTDELAEIATDAILRYGKGQDHPACLNFGDCMAYALAKSLDAPLLFKGEDFSKTDIRSAL